MKILNYIIFLFVLKEISAKVERIGTDLNSRLKIIKKNVLSSKLKSFDFEIDNYKLNFKSCTVISKIGNLTKIYENNTGIFNGVKLFFSCRHNMTKMNCMASQNEFLYEKINSDEQSIILNGTIEIAVNFEKLYFYQKSIDHSFWLKYPSQDIFKSTKIKINGEDIIQFLNLFQLNNNDDKLYRIFIEKIYNRTINNMYERLLFKPECDSFYYYRYIKAVLEEEPWGELNCVYQHLPIERVEIKYFALSSFQKINDTIGNFSDIRVEAIFSSEVDDYSPVSNENIYKNFRIEYILIYPDKRIIVGNIIPYNKEIQAILNKIFNRVYYHLKEVN